MGMNDDCCKPQSQGDGASHTLHLVVIGGGSAAFAAAIRASDLGGRATIINDGLPTGGTCVNVGCVPSKTLIRAADVLHRANRHEFAGIRSRADVADFSAVIEQKRELVTELRQAKYLDVIANVPSIRLVQGRARFVSENAVSVNGELIRGDRFLIATGATPFAPPIPGLEEAGYLTNESLFELEELPESVIVLGGRYIALECAQMIARFGSRVAILQRSDRILPTESPDLTDALAGYLRDEGIQIETGVTIRGVRRDNAAAVVDAEVGGVARTFRAAKILVATGRKPNTRGLGLDAMGVEVDRQGFVQVDDTLRTTVRNIFAAGDVLGENMFVYTAAYEGALAAENALQVDFRTRDYDALPWVIFTDPQVAGVGLDEHQAAERGLEVDVATLPMSHVPRCIAARDTRGVVKLIREKSTDHLVGARILAPEGSELLMELSLAIKHGITTGELASSFHAYLTLGEAIKLAALTFGKDVSKLSCCAT